MQHVPRIADKLADEDTVSPGAHPTPEGVRFSVWAPNAWQVELIGDFNGWQGQPMERDGTTGRWSAQIPHARHGEFYKYRVHGVDGVMRDKADPCAHRCELPPGTASQIWSLGFEWGDADWMATRGERQGGARPMSIYEVHLGSWQRDADGRFLNYRELGQRLAAHCTALGFTHVELMPVAEHPFYGSWGYQTTGYFAPTARYGTPQDLMALVDTLHRAGIGVVLDWVGSHFPGDPHALERFDGTALYEHADPRQGFHPEWNSLIFNYGRHEVRDFLIDSVLFWLRHYHFDAVRVDAVSSMLYLDFARRPGEWIPNHQGGHHNLEAVRFLQDLNTQVYAQFPDVHTIAEESTAWPGVSRPVHHGGLGFGMKWNMGWMNDTLRYMQRPMVYRRWHEKDIRFSAVYAFDENFVLPLSHDEVVYGKGSLLQRHPGDEWQRFAGLRNLYGYMWGHPGKKLLFMGGEFGQPHEWHHEAVLAWPLCQQPLHAGLLRWVADLNRVYRALPAMHAQDFGPAHFEWLPLEHGDPDILAFLRRHGDEVVLVICNFSAQARPGLRMGTPFAIEWHELLNSDANAYGGSGAGNFGGAQAQPVACGGMPASLLLTAPPLATVLLSNRSLPPLESLIQGAPHVSQQEHTGVRDGGR
ncbi:1,4-alpha-glucan branching protein GlgB [Hydrogenophaga sp. BPS33]|uniref:1,4-alpha-glucan branching protein GlgB n=1 Tax=Hydrogenophaga sp. BPS33 TaxID=2651974 RepID=UPI00132006AE|nr:1,4-alpha-glucan branching protein GlgB [Hydrogenophaga sp. BPS33]QHE86637.1 1,4-alpha-glucan branching protein GlgB [Hydrogenophaga sp. BPS33]